MAPNDRLAQFKNHGKDVESGRLRRKEDVIELRKARKDEQLSKRRNINMDAEESDLDEGDSNNLTSPARTGTQPAIPDIDELVKGIHSTDVEIALRFTHMSRRVLSKERNPPIDKFIELKAVPRLVELLKVKERPDLQFEAAWALTNIASGTADQTRCVVDAGACPLFIQLLECDHNNVAEQAVWALANIAGDGPQYRDMLIHEGIIPFVIKLVKREAPCGFLANVSWCLSNLCRNKNPPPPLEAVVACLPAIKELLMHESNPVVSDACWSLSYISDGNDDRIQQVVDQGVLDRLVNIIHSSHDRNLVVPALRTLGNIVTGNDAQTQAVIDHDALQAFRQLMSNDVLNLRKEVAWTLSNITAGNQNQIQAVIDAGLVPFLIELIQQGDGKTQKEATWAVSNFTCGGSVEQIALLVQKGVLQPLINMLTQNDSRVTMVVLDAVKNILQAGDKMNQRENLCEVLEEMGLIDQLEYLQAHENKEIYEMAVKLVDEYWGGDDNGCADAEVADDGQQYVFNLNAPKSDDTEFQF
ncbi:importin subunit alpha-1-like [Tropilaelaps mercedesae]|uniref:Importin subunit alpha n=1 Tax=Tropilaelaps mercedesae TaxID=418985 RepID=A0A1V9X3M1_9ACAR|nr:importin subunit alpha-1-like [Tropilaelaps mercedesae]